MVSDVENARFQIRQTIREQVKAQRLVIPVEIKAEWARGKALKTR
ncbi:hypothetical protein [Streptomyces sp. NPDC096033]